MYRRIVSYIRQSLTVALCLHDDEVVDLCPSFPAVSTCPSVRLEAWSGRSMQLAASWSLSSHFDRPHLGAAVDATTDHNVMPSARKERLATDGSGSVPTDTPISGDEGQQCWFDVPGKGGVCLWSGATHAHLVGALAFGRFQSTVTAFKDPPMNSVPSSLEDSQRLFDAWMVLATPSCCVEVFQAVEACSGGDGVLKGEESSSGDRDQPSWGALKARCFRAMAEEGRGPRAASLDDVLLLFKHMCRLGCRRQVKADHVL